MRSQNRWIVSSCRSMISRKTFVPDAEKWGARFEELVQLSGLLGQ